MTTPHDHAAPTTARDLKDLLGERPIASVIEETNAALRREPASATLRWLLFQLLCLAGQWQRGMQQLQTWATLEPTQTRKAQLLRELLRAEVYRTAVLQGQKRPGWLDQPEAWSEQLADALAAEAEGKQTEGDTLRQTALDAATSVAGRIQSGQHFHWISDSDSRIGPQCELIFAGGYRWLPFSRIASMSFGPVQEALDLVWRPCLLQLRDETRLNAYMPSRYPVTAEDDLAHLLCQTTSWHDASATAVIARGQRSWLTDSGDIALLEVLSLHGDDDASDKTADA